MNGDYSGLAPPNKIIGQLARCLLLFNRRCQFVIVYGAWRVLILYPEKAWYQTFLVNTAKRKWSIARVTLTDIVTICLHVSFPITPQTTPTSHCYFLSRVPRQSRTTFINITLVYHLHPPFLSLSPPIPGNYKNHSIPMGTSDLIYSSRSHTHLLKRQQFCL